MNRQDYRWEIQAKGKTTNVVAALLKIRGVKTASEKKEFCFLTWIAMSMLFQEKKQQEAQNENQKFVADWGVWMNRINCLRQYSP